MQTVLQQLDLDLAEVARRGREALVLVENGHGAGAGTIWHPEGLVVTNAHVVGRARQVRVTLPDGHPVPGRVLALDVERDMAAVAVDATGLPTIAIGDSTRLRPGEWVLAVGNPWGVVGSVTAGIVIGTGRDWPDLPPSRQEWVLVNLRLRPGYSGGPLLDVEGRIVGMNTMMTGPEIGVAAPVRQVKAFLKEAIGRAGERRAGVADAIAA